MQLNYLPTYPILYYFIRKQKHIQALYKFFKQYKHYLSLHKGSF